MKSFVAIAVVALFAVASSHKVAPRNIITDIIENIINKNRNKLENLNVPSIDLGEFGSVTNLTLVGLEKFVLEKLEATGPLAVDIKNATITLATGSATASIDLKNVEIPEIGLVVNGVGSVDGRLDDFFLTVALDLKLEGLTPVLVDFTQLYIHIGKIQATITGVDNVDTVNEIVNSQLAQFLNDNLVLIAEENKPAIIEFINKILAGLITK